MSPSFLWDVVRWRPQETSCMCSWDYHPQGIPSLGVHTPPSSQLANPPAKPYEACKTVADIVWLRGSPLSPWKFFVSPIRRPPVCMSIVSMLSSALHPTFRAFLVRIPGPFAGNTFLGNTFPGVLCLTRLRRCGRLLGIPSLGDTSPVLPFLFFDSV